MKDNRSAIWAIIGVIIGFSLPVIACMGLTIVFALSLFSLGGQGPVMPILPTQISGPPVGPAVALIEISGPIVSGEAPLWSTSPVAASGDIIPLIQAAALESDVRAIVLDINSPGGSVVPSDEIYNTLKGLKIPIVVSMGELAASGAYYLSMAAEHIVANPNTLTGSIGVITEFPDASELLEKIGVQFTIIEAGEAKDFGSPYRPMNPEEQAYWQALTNETYSSFVAIVAEGRDLTEDQVLELADGRVFSGRQALDLGLVDSLGYKEDAIARAAELGDITGEPRVLRYRRVTTLNALLRESLRGGRLVIPLDWLRRSLSPTLEFRWIP